jgi:hypothetical protein
MIAGQIAAALNDTDAPLANDTTGSMSPPGTLEFVAEVCCVCFA